MRRVLGPRNVTHHDRCPVFRNGINRGQFSRWTSCGGVLRVFKDYAEAPSLMRVHFRF